MVRPRSCRVEHYGYSGRRNGASRVATYRPSHLPGRPPAVANLRSCSWCAGNEIENPQGRVDPKPMWLSTRCGHRPLHVTTAISAPVTCTNLAEGEGFEPSEGCPSHDFQSRLGRPRRSTRVHTSCSEGVPPRLATGIACTDRASLATPGSRGHRMDNAALVMPSSPNDLRW
jgi:hypothetical protein